jgi:hypothetical protein
LIRATGHFEPANPARKNQKIEMENENVTRCSAAPAPADQDRLKFYDLDNAALPINLKNQSLAELPVATRYVT